MRVWGFHFVFVDLSGFCAELYVCDTSQAWVTTTASRQFRRCLEVISIVICFLSQNIIENYIE